MTIYLSSWLIHEAVAVKLGQRWGRRENKMHVPGKNLGHTYSIIYSLSRDVRRIYSSHSVTEALLKLSREMWPLMASRFNRNDCANMSAVNCCVVLAF